MSRQINLSSLSLAEEKRIIVEFGRENYTHQHE